MCGPVATFALSAAQTMAAQGAKNAQYTQQKQAWNQNYQNSLAAGRNEIQQTNLRQMQEGALYAQRDRKAQIEAAERRASINVASAGANVTGLSVDNIIADVTRKTEANRATLQTNWDMTAQQLQTEKDAITNKTQSRIGQVANPIAPDPTGSYLEIAGAGFKAYSDYGKM